VAVSDLSRLARNIEDQAATLTELSRLKVKLHSIDEPMLNTTAAGRLSANLLGRINQYHSDSLGERVTYRMDAGIKAGRPISLAPLGYLNTRANGTAHLIQDPERAPLIRKAFEADRQLHKRRCAAHGHRDGFDHTQRRSGVSKHSFHQMMGNAAYKGWVVSRTRNVQVKGTHEPTR
jgi:DNA invertase Pin-like site-specific DNA recombinase